VLPLPQRRPPRRSHQPARPRHELLVHDREAVRTALPPPTVGDADAGRPAGGVGAELSGHEDGAADGLGRCAISASGLDEGAWGI